VSWKGDLATLGTFGLLGLVCIGAFALIPDREISDDRYVEIAQEVAACPDAQSALDAANKDHVILGSEASNLESIIKEYIEQDERVTKAQNVDIAKGLTKGPLRKRTCLPVTVDTPATAKLPTKR
jgi:hypothetical protein